MPSPQLQSTLDKLFHISHVLGSNDLFTQAGGGNTSVKTEDGRVMCIKASGTPLGQMCEERGWVAVDLAKLQAVFATPDLRTCPTAERERRVLELLNASILEPADTRASVETPLHALLDRVVMHGHPVAANALSCHPDGRKLLSELFVDRDARPPLWVPYIDPGSTLAFRLADIIAEYRSHFDAAPDILLLQNHGLFVTAADVCACVAKNRDVLDRMETWFVDRFPAAISATQQKKVAGAVRAAQGEGAVVKFSVQPELVETARGRHAELFRGALTPDHVVYMGPAAVYVEKSFTQSDIQRELTAFHAQHGVHARTIVARGATVCFAGESRKRVDAAEALALSAVRIARLSGYTTRFIEENDVAFIMNWEAESYRVKQ